MQGSGPSIADEIASNDLIAGGGTVAFMQPGEQRFSVEFSTADAFLQVADVNFGDVGPNPISAWGRFYVPVAAWATNRTFMGKRATSGSLNRWYTPSRGTGDLSETTQSSIALVAQDAVNSSVSARNQSHDIFGDAPHWIDIIVVIDPVGGLMSIRTGPGSGESKPINISSSLGNFGGGNFAVGQHTSTDTEPGMRCSYLSMWTGRALSIDEQIELMGVGQIVIGAPSGLAEDIAGGFSVGLNPET
jgi:hypothetical protein